MPRLDVVIDGEFESRDWAEPYFMVAFRLPVKIATVLLEDFL